MNEQTSLEEKTRVLLEESTSRLDGRTRSRLTQARHAALAQTPRPSPVWWRLGVPVGAAAVLAVMLLNGPVKPVDTAANSGAEDMEMLADAEAPDFVDDAEDLEFYEWAAGEMES